MALSNKERVGRALDLLERGLYPFVEIQFKNEYGDDWEEKAKDSVRELRKRQQGEKLWDVQALLSLMWNNWNSIFSKILSRNDRSLVNELRDIRNAWAHQGAFILDDAYRALDSVERLLKAVSASEAQEVGASKREILRLRFVEELTRLEVAQILFDRGILDRLVNRESIRKYENQALEKLRVAARKMGIRDVD